MPSHGVSGSKCKHEAGGRGVCTEVMLKEFEELCFPVLPISTSWEPREISVSQEGGHRGYPEGEARLQNVLDHFSLL